MQVPFTSNLHFLTRALVLLLAAQAAAFGQVLLFPLWAPSAEPCTGADISYVPDPLFPPRQDYEVHRTYQGSSWCILDISVPRDRPISLDRGTAILKEVVPDAERGQLQTAVITHSGCLAIRTDTYSLLVISQDLSFCPGPVTPRFLGAKISNLWLVVN